MRVYEKEYTLENKKLSTGGLLRILQDVSTLHCNEIGLGVEVIGPKGLIWVAVRQRVEVSRWPSPGEHVTVHTWPGITRHMMFPRFYLVKAEDGETIISGSALWTMVDMNTRKMINPSAYGLELEGMVTGEESKIPSAVKKIAIEQSVKFTVPAEYMDANRHMNNTRYYDMAESCLGGDTEGLCLKEALTEFISEALEGDEMTVSWGKDGGRFYVSGENEGPVFRMSLEYR